MITNAVINGLYIFLIGLIAYDIVCEICECIMNMTLFKYAPDDIKKELIRSVKKK